MKEDFLTIPDAPNYEINSELVCRNKKTGSLMKLHKNRNGKLVYTLTDTPKGTYIRRMPETLFKQAQVAVAVGNEKFEPIPSLGGKYEINPRGVMRNARTKKNLRLRKYSVTVYTQEGRWVARRVKDFLWEVYGSKKKFGWQVVPVSAETTHGKFFFPNIRACARFLSPKIFYSVATVESYLNRRKRQIGEWTITYPNEQEVQWNSRGLNSEARRQSRVWGAG